MANIEEMLKLMAHVQETVVNSPKWKLKGVTFNEAGAPPTFVWTNTDKSTELMIKPEITNDGYNFVIAESSIHGETEIAKFNAKSSIRKPLFVFKIAYDFMADLIKDDTEANKEKNKESNDITI